ncbi:MULTISPECIES: hypothetical protein [Bacillus cereus group]|uniref:Uncharacterized protein n=3 Tax=Bacillus thuringiensis TaxID=1428 RepID=A0AAP4QCT5_BACTU|nr:MULTISPECIES: hypothetical protein [Bacillus cereus group]MCX3323542.1 hypothetical protein [Bacillus paranthracis]MCX3330080.1 hypothetical protein [Bacillus pacificus]MEC2877559.1 hypothetical protein [Bacillus cereus]ABP73619.1 hypothetical protein [Bacillus thuringiensis]AEA19678.1 hypothetical protein CT43_P51062 [Bacillus thuringiensis serovar chinensis CT-43]
MELLKTQQCPYCESIVEDCRAEWEEGSHEVECDSCNKKYQVQPIYDFKGFEVQKVCDRCNEVEEDCYCDDEEDEN